MNQYFEDYGVADSIKSMKKSELKVAAKRLGRLSQFLQDSVKPKKFNLRFWVNTEGLAETTKDVKAAVENESCGTTACAFGHGPLIPEFRRAGLKYASCYGYTVEYDGTLGFSAAKRFFKVDLGVAEYLFDPEAYDQDRQSKAYVIRRINSVVNRMNKRLESM